MIESQVKEKMKMMIREREVVVEVIRNLIRADGIITEVPKNIIIIHHQVKTTRIISLINHLHIIIPRIIQTLLIKIITQANFQLL